MKRIIALIIISFITFFGLSLQNSLSEQIFDNMKKEDSATDVYLLPKDQYADWQNIYDVWFHTQFHKCLKQNRIKMRCSKCEYVYMDVYFEIDSLGKICKYVILKEKMCATVFTKKLRKSFMDYFLNQEYPKSLHNTKFKARLGTGLKC